ncbi:MAG: tetratricopeptide repeat protein [Myxococcota bacterium]|nr:tetratricopeptide repeat protein [Myxococcota bacterium]
MGGEAFATMALWQANPDDVGYREDFLERVGELRGLDSRHERLPPLLLASAHAYGASGRPGEAEEALATLVRAWPEHELAGSAWDDLGARRMELEDWIGAVEAYRGYLRHVPDGDREADVRCLLAFAYLQQGQRDDAASASVSLLERLDPVKKEHDRTLWNETVKILAAARASGVDDERDLRQQLGGDEQPWTVDLLLAILAVHAADGEGELALAGLELLRERGRIELDTASDTVKHQLVDCCLALRQTHPDDGQVQRWLLEAAAALDLLGRQGEAGEVLQWLREHAANASVRREARERQLRVD